jgi:hypothetical protein
MYGRKFRRFMAERFSLSDEDYPETLATVKKHSGGDLPKGVAQLYWKRMHATKTDGAANTSKAIYIYELRLTQQREEGDDPSPADPGWFGFHRFVRQNDSALECRRFFCPAQPLGRWSRREISQGTADRTQTRPGPTLRSHH